MVARRAKDKAKANSADSKKPQAKRSDVISRIPPKASFYLRLGGEPETLKLLRDLLDQHPTVKAFEQHGESLVTAIELQGRSDAGRVHAAAERFVASASGLLRLYAGVRGTLTLKGIGWWDPKNPEKGSGGISYGIARVGRRVDATELLERTQAGDTVGAALIAEAERGPWLGKVLGVVAKDEGWFGVYMLLELLASHYSPTSAKERDWKAAFAELAKRHDVTVARLKDLKQTANYHRHAEETPPVRPWGLPEAWEFVGKGARLAVQEYLARPVEYAIVGTKPEQGK